MLIAWRRIPELASRLALVAGSFFAVLAIVLVPRGAIVAPGRAAALVVAGIVLAVASIGLVWSLGRRARSTAGPPRDGDGSTGFVVGLGMAAQVAIAYVLQPVQTSDAGAYLELAHRLVDGKAYQSANGQFGFWPPGLPLFLYPFARVLDSDFAILLAANLVLFGATAFALSRLTRTLFDRRAALVAVFLFTIWPTRLLLSTQASKETLTLAMVTIGLALAVHLSPRRSTSTNVACAALIGASLGLATLAQPGLTLLFAVLPLAFWFVLQRFRLGTLMGLCAVAVLAMMLVVYPWMVRNHLVSQGAFNGISTNGGSVFYRANNDLATGEFTPRGTVDLATLPEVEQNSEGFRLGKAWIASHPLQFARLAALKVVALLDSDGQGVYWAIERRSGATDDESRRALTGLEQRLRDMAKLASDAFWVLLCAGVALQCARFLRASSEARQKAAALLYPFLYCCVIFAIFESGTRQHIVAVAAMIALASSAATASTTRESG